MIKRITSIQKSETPSKLMMSAALLMLTAIGMSTATATMPAQQTTAVKVNEAVPVHRVDPAYPAEAITAMQEGSVILRFDISETGKPDNVVVVDSTPAGIFDANAVEAFEQWQYKPRIQGGKAMRQTGLHVQLDFSLQ